MQFKIAVALAVLLFLVQTATGRGGYHTRKRHCKSSSYIKGPRRVEDKIAIVGAGAAGVHMAYMLKQKGFKDVTILEKEHRVGGKIFTINYRGAPQDVGAVYVPPGYEESVIPLIKKYIPNTMVPLPTASVWLDGFNNPMTYPQYVAMQTLKNFNTTNKQLALKMLVGAIQKYIRMHQRLFGNYTGELMPRPSAAVMHEIRGTFMEFLQRNGLTSLQPIFLASYTLQGFGYLDEIAAFYGLMWHTPIFINFMLRRLRNVKDPGIYMLKNGFQPLLETMIKKEGLHVKYGFEVEHVHRRRHGFWLCTKWHAKCMFYNFVIWSPDLGESIHKFHNANEEEMDVFSRMNAAYLTTSIVDTLGARRSTTPLERLFSNVLAKREHSVWGQRDSYAALRGYIGPSYQNGSYPSGNDGKAIRTTVGYQYGKTKPTNRLLKPIMEARMKKMGASYVKIKGFYHWRYSPKFSRDDIQAGILWDIIDMQGKYGMWYIGSSVSFESVKSVVEYNKMLISKMKPPRQ